MDSWSWEEEGGGGEGEVVPDSDEEDIEGAIGKEEEEIAREATPLGLFDAIYWMRSISNEVRKNKRSTSQSANGTRTIGEKSEKKKMRSELHEPEDVVWNFGRNEGRWMGWDGMEWLGVRAMEDGTRLEARVSESSSASAGTSNSSNNIIRWWHQV